MWTKGSLIRVWNLEEDSLVTSRALDKQLKQLLTNQDQVIMPS